METNEFFLLYLKALSIIFLIAISALMGSRVILIFGKDSLTTILELGSGYLTIILSKKWEKLIEEVLRLEYGASS